MKFRVSIFGDELHPIVNDALPPCIINITEYKFYFFIYCVCVCGRSKICILSYLKYMVVTRRLCLDVIRHPPHTHTCRHTHTHTEKLIPKNVAEAHFRPFLYLCLMMYETYLNHLLHRSQGQHNLYGHSQQAARSGVQTPVVITAFLLTVPFQTGLVGQPTFSTMTTRALSPGVK